MEDQIKLYELLGISKKRKERLTEIMELAIKNTDSIGETLLDISLNEDLNNKEKGLLSYALGHAKGQTDGQVLKQLITNKN